ncbi:WXG100 family type VII secretion target [Nocardia sp. NPDC057663]|uniref:WXG100 family type VII secretion target n=1 Tax=Nocardia sp. NPDC057663 TaxID=3346201 RepID=UPI00366D4D9A
MAFEDPAIVTKELTFEFAHSKINDAFNPLQPNDNALAAAGQYTQIAQKWRQGVTDFAARMNRASTAAWEGQAAEKSRTAITNYTQRATDLTPELEALANRVSETAQAITLTKDNLPPVVDKFSWGSPSTWFGLKDDERDDAEEKARQVMNDNYLVPFTDADKIVPKLSTPVSPTNPLYGPGDDDTGGAGTNNNNGTGGDTSGGATGGGDDPAATDPATTEDPTEEDPGTETDDGTDDDSSDDDSSDDDSTDDDTTPSSATPTGDPTSPAATSPTATTPTTGSPGGGTGGGGGGAGSPGTGLSAPSPGRSVAGAPVAGVPGTAGIGSAAASAGRAGMPGMMGAPGAGRGRGGDDDDEHKIPDYLINAENTEELLGEQQRTIAGGVIGGDAPAAAPAAPTQPEQH